MTTSNITKEIQDKLQELEIMLKKHDKYFDYSDDHSVYVKGKAEWDDIKILSNCLKLAGYTPEVQELFTKYY